MNKRVLPFLTLGMAAASASAQVYVTTEQPLPNLTSVTNEGSSVGANDQNCPFYIWNAPADTYLNIGGISSGQGVGGQGVFAGDGRTLVAPCPDEALPYNTEWVAAMMPDYADYDIHGIVRFSTASLYAYGSKRDGSEGIILFSSNDGLSWRRYDFLVIQDESGSWLNVRPDFPIRFVGVVTDYCILAGGDDGNLYMSRANESWQIVVPDGTWYTQEVTAYTAAAMMYGTDDWGGPLATDCCIGAELEDGTGAVFYSNDGTDTFANATGVEGTPLSMAAQGDRFLMTTTAGVIQVSDDFGTTWRTVFTDPDNRPLRRIVMNESSDGVVVTDNIVYITEDNGSTWEAKNVLGGGGVGIGFPPTCDWQDAAWNGDLLTVVGTGGKCYQSDDFGATFTQIRGFAGDLGAVVNDVVCCVMGNDGVLYTKNNQATYDGYGAALYDLESGTWATLATTGYPSGQTASSPWGFSGDGRHAVGLSHDYDTAIATVPAYAVVWDGTESVQTLPNRFASINRACRANAVSYDGSVIAGWQDIWGPWYGCVWRRADDGSYTQTMLTIDPTVSFDDIDPEDKSQTMAWLPGFAQCVTDDGRWVGGQGTGTTTATKGPWIWSEDTGIIELSETMGCVADIRNDGRMAVGWQGTGQGAWIWDDENGTRLLQDYLENELGYDMGDFTVVSVYDISPNGRFICGYGMDGFGTPRGYVIDLMYESNGIERLERQLEASIYPNPVCDELHVALPFDCAEAPTVLTMTDMQGRTVRRADASDRETVIDVRGLTPGIYLLTASNAAGARTCRVIVK